MKKLLKFLTSRTFLFMVLILLQLIILVALLLNSAVSDRFSISCSPF